MKLDVRIGLVVAQQDIEARLALLDEVVFEGQSLAFVVDEDVVQIDGLAHQGTCLGVRLRGFEQVRTDAGAEVLRLADVDDLAVCVLVEIDPGLGGEGPDFFLEIHES